MKKYQAAGGELANSMDEPTLVPFTFDIYDLESIDFAVSGTKVLLATIEVNSVLLSKIVPDQENGTNEKCSLNFFGGVAFHRGLIPALPVKVTLFTEGETPSLSLGILGESRRWSDDTQMQYREPVVVGSDSGPKKLTIVYTPYQCGFVAG